MKTRKLLAVAAVAVTATTGLFAQSNTQVPVPSAPGTPGPFSNTSVPNPADEAGPGLLGKRAVLAGFAYQDLNHIDVDVFGLGAGVNFPFTSNIDLGATLVHQWVEGNSDADADTLDLQATYYLTQGALKPFGTLSIGQTWFDGDNTTNWGAAAGVEFAVNQRIAVDATVGYSDNFEDGDNSSWSGTVAANYWFTRLFAVRVGATLYEYGHTGLSVAAIWRF